jgi:mRNA interferase MazF
VLVSRNQAYQLRNRVTVIPLTRTVRGLPVELPLGPADGVSRSSVANADDIAIVPKVWIEQYLTTLNPAKLEALEQAIRFALDLQ